MICAVYARKSNDQNGLTEEAKSVARQVEHASNYATRKGWTVSNGHIYIDDGISGALFGSSRQLQGADASIMKSSAWMPRTERISPISPLSIKSLARKIIGFFR